MREIIPLKKDIIFKTKVAEVTSINLEHDYKILDDMVEGTVYLSGSYKMTEASVIEEDFVYNIPFSIAISKRIDKDTIKIDIDDFKYEVIKDVIKVDISLELTCNELERKEEIKEEIKEEKELEIEDNITNIDFDNYMDDYFKDESVVLFLDHFDTLSVRDKAEVGQLVSEYDLKVVIASGFNEVTQCVEMEAAHEILDAITNPDIEKVAVETIEKAAELTFKYSKPGDIILHMGPLIAYDRLTTVDKITKGLEIGSKKYE